MYKRILSLDLAGLHSCFLWGPRQTGKSTLLAQLLPAATVYDLLQADVYRRLVANPSLLREECLAQGLTGANQKHPVIIDEVQKIPELLDEVHWLIERRGIRFILCGSSARKLRRGHANLLGGRAVRYELGPLVAREIPGFSLQRALNHGLLPSHYDSDHPQRLLQSYIGDYLREEIVAEAATRNLGAFSRFLEVAALSNGGTINATNIARECGVSAPTVRSYFDILEATLIGRFLPAFGRSGRRRLIESPRFYFFDVGIAGALCHRGEISPGSELFGRAFEHFIYLELAAYCNYNTSSTPLSYWRTASGLEVDFILGEGQIALEAKATPRVHAGHLGGLRAFQEEHRPSRAIVVSLDPRARILNEGIEVLPWKAFLNQLWSGQLLRGTG